MKHIIHQCPQAPQEHGIQLGIIEDDVLERVHNAKLQWLVSVNGVVEITRAAVPVVAEREVTAEQDRGTSGRQGDAGRGGDGPVDARQAAVGEHDRRTLADRRPELLVAHAYTRYLGDLSGGPILRRITARAFGLVGDAGLAFYAFPEIADLPSFKLDYRSRLDELPVDEALTEELIAEACRAFELNGAIFKELSGSAAKGLWKLLSHSLSVAKLEPAHDEGAVQTSVLFR